MTTFRRTEYIGDLIVDGQLNDDKSGLNLFIPEVKNDVVNVWHGTNSVSSTLFFPECTSEYYDDYESTTPFIYRALHYGMLGDAGDPYSLLWLGPPSVVKCSIDMSFDFISVPVTFICEIPGGDSIPVTVPPDVPFSLRREFSLYLDYGSYWTPSFHILESGVTVELSWRYSVTCPEIATYRSVSFIKWTGSKFPSVSEEGREISPLRMPDFDASGSTGNVGSGYSYFSDLTIYDIGGRSRITLEYRGKRVNWCRVFVVLETRMPYATVPRKIKIGFNANYPRVTDSGVNLDEVITIPANSAFKQSWSYDVTLIPGYFNLLKIAQYDEIPDSAFLFKFSYRYIFFD